MTENDNGNDIKSLRQKTGPTPDMPQFSKVLMGGINPAEVYDYISSLNSRNNATIEAYTNRIDEFTTYSEMLTKEKSENLAVFETLHAELEQCRNSLTAANSALDELRQENEHLKSLITELESALPVESSSSEREIALTEEINALRIEIRELVSARDAIAGSAAAKTEEIAVLSDTVNKSMNDLRELEQKHQDLKLMIRQIDMESGMRTSEFADKHLYSLSRSTETLGNLIEEIGKLKAGVSEYKNYMIDSQSKKEKSI